MRRYYQIVIVCTSILFIFSCTKKGESEIVHYSKLKPEIQREFIKLYNEVPVDKTPRFAECINLEEACGCIVKKDGLLGNKIMVESCNSTFMVPMKYLHRVFVVDLDTIYIPNTNKGAMLKYGKPRSSTILIDTISFLKFYGKVVK